MFFYSLRTTSFRNLLDIEISTAAKDIFLVGENGQGKTNFLEALYFCAFASSFRTDRDNELANNDKKDFSVEAKIEQSLNDNIFVKYNNGKKSIFINGKRVQDRKELLSAAPCIVFCHEDMEFVTGTPERRRWFFDQTLCLYDPVYLDDFRRYRHVLKSRNTVLKDYAQNKYAAGHTLESLSAVLEALDPQLVMYGQKLMEKREQALKQFSAVLNPLYEEVSGLTGVTVQYIPSWKGETDLTGLQDRRPADIAAGHTLSGPHRDKYVFSHNGSRSENFREIFQHTEFTKKASTGQCRLLALLLRTAQARLFSEMNGFPPILLLDDVLLEMDGTKRQRFLSVMPEYSQAFYTFLPDEPYQNYCKPDTLIYKVKDGQIFSK